MKLLIKAAKVGKRGTHEKFGDWTLVVLTAENGEEWTTLHKDAEKITAGMEITIDKISIGEPDAQGRIKRQFKEFLIVGGATATGPDNPAPENGGKAAMTPADWTAKDLRDRASFEAQTAFKGIMSLQVASAQCTSDGGFIGDTDKLKEVTNLALDWAKSKLAIPTTAPAPAQAPKATTAPPVTAKTQADKDFENLESGSQDVHFKNAGEFLMKCSKELKIYPQEICNRLGVSDVKEIASLEEAWATLTEEPEDIPFAP